jgi:hypothetical protein
MREAESTWALSHVELTVPITRLAKSLEVRALAGHSVAS